MKPSGWRVLSAVTATLLGALFLAGTVAADEGPHGGYSATTGKCQSCHSPHRAGSLYILRGGSGTIYGFCITCHGGGDARTNVLAGQWTAGDASFGIPNSYGDASKQLNGGRFSSGTSTHSVSGEQIGLTIWGGNDITGEDVAMSSAFRCTTCHDPHGKTLADVGGTGTQANLRTDNYRLLNMAPVKSWESESNLGAGVTKSYTRVAWQGDGFMPGGITMFCVSCHADYLAQGMAGGVTPNRPSGIAWGHQIGMMLTPSEYQSNLQASAYKLPLEITSVSSSFKYYSVDYSNPTAAAAATITRTNGTAGTFDGSKDKIGCVPCHNAHGSVAVETEQYAQNATGDPSLLRFNNRTVCQSCHAKGI